jgi:hypothetical protein
MNPVKVIKYTFTTIGAVMLAGAFIWYQNTSSFVDRAARADGVVVDLTESRSRDSDGSTSTLYTPVVVFTDDQGKETRFSSSVSSSPPSHDIGEKVQVLYLPGQSRSASINSTMSLWFGHFVLGGLGTVFFLIGAGFFLAPVLGAGKESRLRSQGTPIQATVQGVSRNTSITVNGRHPYRLTAQWINPATSEIHVFESANIWYDPTPHLHQKQLTVFIDPANPKRYHVDTSFLPKLAG